MIMLWLHDYISLKVRKTEFIPDSIWYQYLLGYGKSAGDQAAD
jgi:hypothetical protein